MRARLAQLARHGEHVRHASRAQSGVVPRRVDRAEVQAGQHTLRQVVEHFLDLALALATLLALATFLRFLGRRVALRALLRRPCTGLVRPAWHGARPCCTHHRSLSRRRPSAVGLRRRRPP